MKVSVPAPAWVPSVPTPARVPLPGLRLTVAVDFGGQTASVVQWSGVRSMSAIGWRSIPLS